MFLAADEALAVPHRRIACPTVAYAAAFEAAAEGGCFLVESAVPAVCHRRQHLFDFGQLFIGNGIVAAGLISTADTDGRNQNLMFVERMDIQAAVPTHLLFIMQGRTVIIVAFGNAVAVAQQLHDGAVARCVLFQYIACFFRYGNGADDCLTAVAFAYQRGRRIQTTLEFVRFQHCRRRAFVGQVPFIFSRADADFAFFFQCFEQGVGLRAVQFACAFFVQRQFAQ